MNPFDKLVENATEPLVDAIPVAAPAVVKPGLSINPFPGMAPSAPVFIQTPDVIVDRSEAKDQDLETLRAFWQYVHKRQLGLIIQFKASRGL